MNDFKENPVGSLVTIRSFPWFRGKTAMLGDSAHAIVPFYGQGMNCCFEDCEDLDYCLSEMDNDMGKALQLFEDRRVVNANAIADLALKNFVEMRDWVGQPDFLARKTIEHDISELYSDEYKTQYELVTFENVSYKHAWDTGFKNDKLIDRIIADKLESKISDKEFMQSLFKEYLT